MSVEPTQTNHDIKVIHCWNPHVVDSVFGEVAQTESKLFPYAKNLIE